MANITIEINDNVFEQFKAESAVKGLSAEAALADYIHSVANDIVLVSLPKSAATRSLLMYGHKGRDLVASILRTNWTAFENPMPQYFFSCALTWPGTIVDIGSNSGYYGMLGACANSSNDVIAFEPDPPVHAALQQNIDVNSLRDRITAFPTALSSTVGTASLFVPSQEHGLVESSSSLEANFKNSHSEVRRVEVDTLDRFLENPAFSQKGISLIKIDVEGHEASVLAGAHATVAKWRPILFVEVLDRADFASLSSFIAQHNYVDVPLRTEGALTAQGIVTYDQTALNHVLVPPERLAEFLRFSRLA